MTDEQALRAAPLHALGVEVSQYLAGSKRAFRIGNTVYVSPAMHELMKGATPDELRLLLGKIELVELPPMPSVFDPLPMTTEPPPRLPEPMSILRRYLT